MPNKEEMITLKYRGSHAGLKALLNSLDVTGHWSYANNHVWILRARGGLVLSWSPVTKSLWLQGSIAARRSLYKQLRDLLMGDLPSLFDPRADNERTSDAPRRRNAKAKRPRD